MIFRLTIKICILFLLFTPQSYRQDITTKSRNYHKSITVHFYYIQKNTLSTDYQSIILLPFVFTSLIDNIFLAFSWYF